APLLMSNCQVSLYPNAGPRTAHTVTVTSDGTNAVGVPTQRETQIAKRLKAVYIWPPQRGRRAATAVCALFTGQRPGRSARPAPVGDRPGRVLRPRLHLNASGPRGWGRAD